MLLDPLPTISDEASGVEPALRSLGLFQPLEGFASTPEMGTPRGTSLPGTAAGGISRNGFVQKSTRVRPRRVKRSVPEYLADLVWGNTNSYRSQRQHQSLTDTESAPGNPIHIRGNTTTHSPPQRSSSILLGNSGQAGQIATDESREISDAGGDIGVQIHTLIPLERSIFCGLLPRGPLLNYNSIMCFDKTASLKQHLNTKTSTAADLAAWIRAYTLSQRNTTRHSGPLDFLFAIVQKDTLNTLRLMDQALAQIKRDVLDDNLIQQRLMKWRSLLERFDAELRSLEKSLSKFAIFIAPLISSSRDDEVGTTSSPLVTDLLRESKIEIANFRHRATSFHQSLMANMSIVESKRGITEAESVTKLTELAFFFIPLTFSASVFSMQVKELNAANVSVSAFIILATIITILSYALRLIIRSESFTRRRGELLLHIRSDTRLSSDASISTTLFLLWIWRRLGFLIVVIVIVLGFIICPITALWTRDINRGFKVFITIMLLTLILPASYLVINAMLHVDRRGLYLRRKRFRTQSRAIRRESTSLSTISYAWTNSFMWIKSLWVLKVVIASAIAVGPLVAIWTRPLESSIKVGATTAIGILYIGTLVFILSRAMYDGKFDRQNEQDD